MTYRADRRPYNAPIHTLCRRKGVSLVLGGIFNSGILATGPVPNAKFDYAPASADILERVSQLQAECAASGTTLPAAALNFGLAQTEVASVLIGTAKISSLRRNLDSALA